MKFHAEINLQNKIVPIYDSDYEALKKLNKNTPLLFEVKKERNYKFLKKFFALIELVYQNQEIYTNKDDLREDLTIEAGFYRTYENIQGNTVKKANSISFAQMDEIEFSEFYNRIIDVIVKWLQTDKQDLIDNIQEYF